MITKFYVNLTNGIEVLEKMNLSTHKVRFIRIQSTWIEQKNFDDLLFTLSDEFLLDLALGNKVIIFDYSQKHRIPKSLWYGLEVIRYVLYKVWLNKEYELPEKFDKRYFEKIYRNLSKKTINKLKYYKKFLNTDTLRIAFVSSKTNLDGQYDKYKEILLKHNKGSEK